MYFHAFRRQEPTVVELLGVRVEFVPNARGDCVAQVLDEAVAQRLLAIPEGYRVYEPGAVEEPGRGAAVVSAEAAPVVFGLPGAGDGVAVERLSARQVRALALARGVVLPSGSVPLAQLRAALAEALGGEA